MGCLGYKAVTKNLCFCGEDGRGQMGIKRESDYFVCVLVTYNPGDALFGNGRREKRGDTGTIGICGSNDLRTNSGDDSIGLCE